MTNVEFCERWGGTIEAVALFAIGPEPDRVVVARLHEALIESYRLVHLQRTFAGYYSVDTESRTISGLRPISWDEFGLYLVHASIVVLGETDLARVRGWAIQFLFERADGGLPVSIEALDGVIGLMPADTV